MKHDVLFTAVVINLTVCANQVMFLLFD